MAVEITFRPIGADWIGEKSSGRRMSQFSATVGQTWELLKRELEFLGASRLVVQIDLRERDIRQDGWPRSNAPEPAFPGVIISFQSEYGPLRYATDRFPRYKENLRAIALGLESLRRVDRYGITKRGEQYTGWRELPAGDADPDLAQRGRELIADHGGETAALKATHPDHGGDTGDFLAVQAARAK